MNLEGNMGRTVPSFRMLLEGIIEELSVFRRALRGEDKEAFDSLMNKAREHASSCTLRQCLNRWMLCFYLYWWSRRKKNGCVNRFLTTTLLFRNSFPILLQVGSTLVIELIP